MFQLLTLLSIAVAHCEGVGFTICDTMSQDRIPSIEKVELTKAWQVIESQNPCNRGKHLLALCRERLRRFCRSVRDLPAFTSNRPVFLRPDD